MLNLLKMLKFGKKFPKSQKDRIIGLALEMISALYS